MLLTIPNVLNQEQLQAIGNRLAHAQFVDGKLSAGKMASRDKNNEEIPMDAADIGQLHNLVMGSLVRHPVYQAAVMPKKIAAPFYARYTAGMGYGEHTDDPVMGSAELYRSDVALTIFLNDPEEYEGGELSIQTSFGTQEIKLPAGHVVIYPASSRHQVRTVRGGQRLVAVTWAQSLIRDPAQRELLYELHQTRESLLQAEPDGENTRRINSCYVNLVRMWAEL